MHEFIGYPGVPPPTSLHPFPVPHIQWRADHDITRKLAFSQTEFDSSYALDATYPVIAFAPAFQELLIFTKQLGGVKLTTRVSIQPRYMEGAIDGLVSLGLHGFH